PTAPDAAPPAPPDDAAPPTPPPAPPDGGVSVVIDGRTVVARPGELVIAAADRHGIEIPRFCYHERMSPVGMCRMCLVEIDTGRGPQLQVSCMVPVADGMSVDTKSDLTRRVQEGVLEHLLINHPLDCPVCDKGGECPLQDQTLAYGPGESRFVEEKRHFAKPIPVSSLVYLDRERCILCDRCTRFADEVAGDALITFADRGNETQILTFPDEPFSSYFSGNTVQICPVGALTAVPYRFKARPWDLSQAESTCTTCSVGCRMAVQSSRDRLVRYLGVDIDPVNHGWLCDKGRFAFEAVVGDARLTEPLRRSPDGPLVRTGWSAALTRTAAAVRDARPGAIAVIGGARGTNEDAYAWSKLARTVFGTRHLDAQLGDGLPARLLAELPPAGIDDACAADTVLLIGPDLKEEMPVLHLRLRGAALAGTTKLVEIGAVATGLRREAHHVVECLGGEIAVAVAELLDG
ncbi:MAG TPA: NADH-quinone oxidoreductase subunit G, partial [Acidimicrobiaceae bacterium]|nr:NADH-quinone oxidoreductase subunit G [Acidimicrobiaceae bacterium]